MPRLMSAASAAAASGVQMPVESELTTLPAFAVGVDAFV